MVEHEELGQTLFGNGVVPRREGAFHGVPAALARRREQAALGAEDVEGELLERRLGKVLEGRHELTVDGVGWIVPSNFTAVP